MMLFWQRSKACKKDIVLGQTVISKHKNLRYYTSRVTEVTSQTFYEVMFDDGSFSNDTFPEDIVVSLLCVDFYRYLDVTDSNGLLRNVFFPSTLHPMKFEWRKQLNGFNLAAFAKPRHCTQQGASISLLPCASR